MKVGRCMEFWWRWYSVLLHVYVGCTLRKFCVDCSFGVVLGVFPNYPNPILNASTTRSKTKLISNLAHSCSWFTRLGRAEFECTNAIQSNRHHVRTTHREGKCEDAVPSESHQVHMWCSCHDLKSQEGWYRTIVRQWTLVIFGAAYNV
jgi:hypothetical protein